MIGYAISEIPINFDNVKFQSPMAILSRFELFDTCHFALGQPYLNSKLYKVALDSLEMSLLCDTGLSNPYFRCAKLLPRYGWEYDWVIAWAYNLGKVYRLSTNGDVVTGLPNQKWGWLNNTGFDWVPSAAGYADTTWIYAEYILDSYTGYGTVNTLNVWRSIDAGATWTSVFTKNTRNHADPEIYHFHVVRRDPYNAGHWYISSGDLPDECFVWRSTDDGLTWTDVSDLAYTDERQKIHRTTNMYFTEDYIYWGVDDYITTDGMGSAWVRASRNLGKGNRLQITHLFNLQNWVISLTQTPYGLVAFTENRPTDTANGLIWLIPYDDMNNPMLIGKTPGCAYGTLVSNVAYGGRIFLGPYNRTPPLYFEPAPPNYPRMIVMNLSKSITPL